MRKHPSAATVAALAALSATPAAFSLLPSGRLPPPPSVPRVVRPAAGRRWMPSPFRFAGVPPTTRRKMVGSESIGGPERGGAFPVRRKDGKDGAVHVRVNGAAPARVDGTNGEAQALQSANDDPRSAPSPSTPVTRPPFPQVLWRFTRPHTLIGSGIAIPSIFLLAAPTYGAFFAGRSLAALAYAMVPALLMNLYITGLNQITDVEIDRINKPELPMAKGDLDRPTATVVVLIALAISLAMSVFHPVFSTAGLQVALWGSFILGTLYSLPPFRMKRHPLLAALCIVAVRGTIINAGFYSHALSSAFGGVTSENGVLGCFLHDWKCASSSFFFGVFGIVIALMKDVPDARGDRTFNIQSFTVRLGQRRVLGASKALLIALFGAFGGVLLRWSAMAPVASVAARRALVGLGCWAAARSANQEARAVDPEDSEEVYCYYMHLWKLFYLSYLALPFVK